MIGYTNKIWKPIIKEYDVVRALRPINATIPRGSIGTVLIVFDAPTRAYEIEFMNNGESVAVLTVYPEDIELVDA